VQYLEVLDDPDELDRARLLGRTLDLGQLFTRLEEDVLSVPVRRAARVYGAKLIPWLEKALRDADGDSKLIGRLLQLYDVLGEFPDWELLLGLIGRSQVPSKRMVVNWLANRTHPSPPDELITLADETDSLVRRQAWRVLGGMRVKGWREQLSAQLRATDLRGAAILCPILAEVGEFVVWEFLRESLGSHANSAHWAWSSLEKLCGFSELRDDCLELARHLATKGNLSAGRMLAAVGQPGDEELLGALMEFADPYTRSVLVQGVLNLGGRQALPDVLKGLNEKHSRSAVLSALSRTSLNDEAIKDALMQIDATELNYQEARELVETLLRFQLSEDTLRPYLHQTLKSDRHALQWKLQRRRVAAGMDRLVELGLVPSLARVEPVGHGPGGLIEQLEKNSVLFRFDSEAPETPPRYEPLLDELSKIGRGVFEPTFVHQETIRDGDGCEWVSLQFLHGGRLYRCRLDMCDDWIDVGHLLDGPNRALQDGGAELRFQHLQGFGQEALILCAGVEPTRVAASEGWFRI
jgi:hypothetical protein